MRWTHVRETVTGDVTMLHVTGEIPSDDGNRLLNQQLDKLLAEGRRHLILDLAAISHIDSKGIADLIGCALAVGRHGGRLTLINVAPGIQRLFARMRLDMLHVCESEDAARQRINAPAGERG